MKNEMKSEKDFMHTLTICTATANDCEVWR